MPDITMCLNKKCSKKNKCYRFLAKPSQVQSYSDFKFKLDNCFLEIDVKRRKNEPVN